MTKGNGKLEIFLSGGLGNQLFQYTSGIALARKTGREIVLRTDLLPRTQDSVRGISRWPNAISQFRHEGCIDDTNFQDPGRVNWKGRLRAYEGALGEILPEITMLWGTATYKLLSKEGASLRHGDVRTLVGHQPNYDLVIPLRTELARQISNLTQPSENFRRLSVDISPQKATAIHLRFGDYVKLSHVYGRANPMGINRALESAARNHTQILVFSDSRNLAEEFCSQHRIPFTEIVDRSGSLSALETLLLMSQTSTLICSNSTFSWWAAFLSNDATVFYPDYPDVKVSAFKGSAVLPGWIGMH